MVKIKVVELFKNYNFTLRFKFKNSKNKVLFLNSWAKFKIIKFLSY
jgi:hypothetical protein